MYHIVRFPVYYAHGPSYYVRLAIRMILDGIFSVAVLMIVGMLKAWRCKLEMIEADLCDVESDIFVIDFKKHRLRLQNDRLSELIKLTNDKADEISKNREETYAEFEKFSNNMPADEIERATIFRDYRFKFKNLKEASRVLSVQFERIKSCSSQIKKEWNDLGNQLNILKAKKEKLCKDIDECRDCMQALIDII